jgi:hypothetical protein
MRRALPMLTTVALLVGACSGGSDDTNDSTVASPDTVATTAAATTPPTEASTTVAETTTSEAPTTTIDDAATLAEAEAAYLEAFEVGLESIRNPDDPDAEDLLRDWFVDGNLDKALENLRLTIDGNFIATENPSNPSFVRVVSGAKFIGDQRTQVELTVCEFNSDRIYEIGTAPGGDDSLVRDNPVSLLFVTQLELVDGRWKSKTGGTADEVRDEIERCTGA